MTEDDSSKEYSVNWKNHMIHIRKAFDNLFTTSQLVDVTLCCDGKKIGAHRMLLSACSNYFREIFKDIPPYQHPVIILNGVEFSVLNDILKFIYNGEVSVDINKLDSFLKTAQMLKISGLTDQNDNERVGENNNNIPPVEPEQVETPRETQQSQQINVQQPQPQEQDISDNLTELISATASTSKEQPRKSVKRQSEEDPSQRAEKMCKPEADNEYLGDIKCEPGDMMTFEESLEDDPLNSEAYQQNDDDDDEDKDFPTTSGTRQPGDDEFKRNKNIKSQTVPRRERTKNIYTSKKAETRVSKQKKNNNRPLKNPGPVPTVRVMYKPRWSPEELEQVKIYFESHITGSSYPSTKNVQQFIDATKFGRTVPVIIAKIQHLKKLEQDRQILMSYEDK